jgi:hypothetical protein
MRRASRKNTVVPIERARDQRLKRRSLTGQAALAAK